MITSSLLFRLVRILFPISVLATTYLYLYPFFNRCKFPEPWTAPSWDEDCAHYVRKPDIAPFRLLALGDPQLEGDSSLPGGGYEPPPTILQICADLLNRTEEAKSLLDILLFDIPDLLSKWRKQVDLFGNDYYLAHQYRTLHWWTQPSHVSVLGDLLGSQWVSDEEFHIRADRFWNRVFKGAQKVEESLMGKKSGTRREELGKDPLWAKRIINIAGNHDIGYAGDLNSEKIARFETAFGKVNWDIRFQLPNESCPNAASVPNTAFESPTLHVVVLNSMNLDPPALYEDIQMQTYGFVNDLITKSSAPVEDHCSATLLLTHIPLYKKDGVCVDGPFTDLYSSEEGGGIREQNHLTEHSSKSILSGIYGKSGNENAAAKGMGRDGIIINGHDHEGCDVWHSIEYGNETWDAERYFSRHDSRGMEKAKSIPSIREITLRSMMGEFGGYAGLLSAWFDSGLGEWQFEFSYCSLGTQHYWWAVHVLDLVTVAILVLIPVLKFIETSRAAQCGVGEGKKSLVKRD